MTTQFQCRVHTQRFDENYEPATSTRLTTNFANLARGENRKENLQNAIRMINNRFNDLAHWDNPTNDRYSVLIDIVSIDVDVAGKGEFFSGLEWLKTSVVDHKTGKTTPGIIGNSFSSFVRDYDFSVLLREYNKDKAEFSVPEGLWRFAWQIVQIHDSIRRIQSPFQKAPVLCLSVATTRTYHRTTNTHPILGVEYVQNDYSLTDEYFAKMGLKVRYFMPPKSVAPYAFYFDENADLLNDYTNLELISTIATMEAFQKSIAQRFIMPIRLQVRYTRAA